MSREWQPIEDLPTDWQSLSDPQVTSVIQVWRERAAALEASKSYQDFLIKLRRQWAIETGILERLYTLSDGATRTLIEQGLDAALISHYDTDKSPELVLSLIRDHHSVIEGLYQFIAGERQLTKSYIRELHQALTAHQETYAAKDSLGNVVDVPMSRGAWKTLPNNVTFDDGTTFEFCPPEHVEAEMDRLIAMHTDHAAKGVSPDVEAAFLHHRFTLIHPFNDGNGRVARALATLILLQARWFPLVVTRDDKVPYLKSLRAADAGDLRALVQFFGELQRRAVRQALSLSEEVEREAKAIKSILASVSGKIAGRRKELLRQYQKAVTTSDALLVMARDRMKELARDITPVIKEDRKTYSAHVHFAPRGDKRAAEYNRFQIVECAKTLGYFANLAVHPSWVELEIDASSWVGILVAFHGVGSGWYGLLGAVAMAYRKELVGDSRKVRQVVDLKPLCSEPFEVVYSENQFEVEQRFRRWLEDALIQGLDYWKDTV